MKKIITLLITLTMVLTMAVPVFADDTATDTDVDTPIAPAQLTKAQVKALKPGGVKAASYSYTKIKVTWNKIEGVDGYKVYRATSKGGKYTVSKTTTSANTTSYINTGRTTGKTYYYKVRGYKKIGKTTYYTKYSPVTSTYARPNKAVITKVTLGGSDKEGPYDRTPKTCWNAVSGATGYEIYRTLVGKNKWSKVYTTTKTYYTDKTKSFRTYYNYEYKVRAYKIVSGKKVYGLFSSPKEFEPEWTMEELMPELIAYGESIKGKKLQYNPATDELEPYTGSEGSTYTFDHCIGFIEDKSTETGYKPVDWNDKEAMENPTFEAETPESSSWSAIWPVYISPYESRQIVLKELKSAIKAEIESEMEANPLIWEPADEYSEAGWTGTDVFTLYYRKANGGLENRKGYHFYLIY
ncbi:MAG: fibronectin type III domain-containing protein [Emergencia sp.]|nr:fibronectin type III domain-containing protein [Emergencia sp.]